MQTFELFDQFRKHLLYYTDQSVQYLDCFTVHKLTVRGKSVYVEVEWFFMNHLGTNDVYVTSLIFISKETYEQACCNN